MRASTPKERTPAPDKKEKSANATSGFSFRRHTPEQVIRKLREADRMLGEGSTVPEVAKALEVSENTYHRWRNQFGGLKATT